MDSRVVNMANFDPSVSRFLKEDPCIILGKFSRSDIPKQLICSDQNLGKWVRACFVPLLISFFEWNEPEFKEHFPEVSLRLNEQQILKIAELLKTHTNTCAGCRSIKQNDEEFGQTLEAQLQELNREGKLKH